MRAILLHPLAERRHVRRRPHKRPATKAHAPDLPAQPSLTAEPSLAVQHDLTTQPSLTAEPSLAVQHDLTAQPDPAVQRVREAGGPVDQASYTCACGYLFLAAVSTTVTCPHCGSGQAW